MSGSTNTLLAVPLAGRFLRDNQSLARWRHADDYNRRHIIEIAAGRSPFYRSLWSRAGIDPQRAGDPENYSRLPLVDQAAWRTLRQEEIMTVSPAAALVWHRTGGSAGEPFLMPYTPADDIRLRASVLAAMRMHGLRWSDRALWFLPPDTHSRGGSRLFGRVRMIDSDATTDDRLDALRSGAEPVLRGYPWPVWRAVVKALRQGVPLPRRRLFVTGGEPLPRCVRRTLERGLGARVVNRYSATDFGQIAVECVAGRLHVGAQSHVEILVGDAPADPGQEGEVVATNGFSRARPLIRVRSGDRATWSDKPCPCGSEVPSLASVSGRVGDCIHTPRGSRVSSADIERALGEMNHGLLGFQFEQSGPVHVRARLCLETPGVDAGETERVIKDLFQGMRVVVEYTDEILTELNGKTRVCRARGLPV